MPLLGLRVLAVTCKPEDLSSGLSHPHEKLWLVSVMPGLETQTGALLGGFPVCPSSLVRKLQVPVRDSILRRKLDCYGHPHVSVCFCCCDVTCSSQAEGSEYFVPASRCLGHTVDPLGGEA